MGGRFVILSAGMGAGHHAVAGELAHRLTGRGHRVATLDVLDLLPAGAGTALRGFYATTIRYAPALYEAIYRAYFVPRPAGGPGGPQPGPDTSPVVAPAARELRRRLAGERPDAVLATFHLAAQVTGRLREAGALRCPGIVVVTDFAVHRQWLHPANDAHLCPTRQTAEDVRRLGGRGAEPVGPLVPAAFRAPPDPARTAAFARRFAERAPGRTPVLLSSGAWGVASHLARTAALLRDGGYLPVVMCGRSRSLRRRIGRVPGTVALGWVADVPALMAAAGALVENAAGQTAAQALAAGLPVVSYRPIPGHGAAGAERMAEAGLSTLAHGPADLLRALADLTPEGPPRQSRIAAGRSLFHTDAADAVLRTAGCADDAAQSEQEPDRAQHPTQHGHFGP
ncbi:galactosyldiacylglycerol synthase [Streptomyces sp. Ru73]|uniref:MGDG synthase family glycosyltransferase n=1 Tax=Streptomyces sp. Ru73 TaxID=2080748 RepID=UPI000CDD2C75|nr:galactosyldiacylglycerol synthase [Streptomyces sp. Ru73]POX38896.1 galactosyldiacylglycerol synthase [Streptomyces sp. Ru73]